MTADLIRFGVFGRRRKYHILRPAPRRQEVLCGADGGGLPRVHLAAEHRALVEQEGRVCAHCLRVEATR